VAETSRKNQEEVLFMDILSMVIQLIAGAVGGNVAGKLLKELDLGPAGNSIAGIVGGGIGGQALRLLGLGVGGSGSMDIGSLLGSVVSGGVGGGMLLTIIFFIRTSRARV
jgi:uncharacterized membrane protein YeaQ/YmgE (transglycosylase-associated protein family)